MSGVIRGTDTVTGSHDHVNISENKLHIAQYVWDTTTLTWVKQTGSSGAPGTEVTVTNFPSTQTVSGTVSITENVRTKRYDQVSDTTAYLGEAAVGSATSASAWRISKFTFSAEGDVIIEYADGNANFDNVWDNRTSLSYV